MFVIRPASLGDISAIEHCAMVAGAGMTHLPKHSEAIQKKVRQSLSSFSSQDSTPGAEDYLFILENHATHQIGGTCGVTASAGLTSPFFVFAIEILPALPDDLPGPAEKRILHLKAYTGTTSEICALYLLPEFRHSGLGRLLSLSRFLFIAAQPHRFFPTLIANMRGYIENHTCAFWEGLGRHFINLSFAEVMAKRGIDDRFLSSILPQHPIYVALLPPNVQAVIGKTHPHTQPALKMLEEQGFHFIQEIDPVDGGPILQADRDQVPAIKSSLVGTVDQIVTTTMDAPASLLSNNRLDFRACYGAIQVTGDRVHISKQSADALQLQKGDSIRYIRGRI